MRPFVFSKRFVIPFLIVFVVHLLIVLWTHASSMLDQMEDSDFSSKLIGEWLVVATLDFTPGIFLLAFAIGLTWYFHFQIPRDKEKANPFSKKHGVTILIIAVIGLAYTMEIKPIVGQERYRLSSMISFGESFEKYFADKHVDLNTKTWNWINPVSLYKRKMELEMLYDSLTLKINMSGATLNSEIVLKRDDYQFELERFQRYFAAVIKFPLTILIYYMLGFIVAFFFRNTVRLVPAIVTYILIIGVLYFAMKYFTLFSNGDNMIWWEMYGATVFITILTATALIFSRKNLRQLIFHGNEKTQAA